MTQSQIELGFSNFGHRAKDTGVKSRVSKMSELAKLSVSSSSLTEEKDIALPFSVKFFYSNVFGGGRNWLIPVSLFVLGLLVTVWNVSAEAVYNHENHIPPSTYAPGILVVPICVHPILAAGYYYGYYLARNRVLLRSLILGELWLINPEESIAMNNRIVLIMILPIACALVAVVGALLFIALSEYDVPDYYQASLVLEIFSFVWGLFVYTFIASQYVWICWIHWKIGKNLVARVVTTDALLAGTSRAPLFHQMKAARESRYLSQCPASLSTCISCLTRMP